MSFKQTEKLMQTVVDELNEPELLLLIALSSDRLAKFLKDKPFLLERVLSSIDEMTYLASHLRRAVEV